MMSARVQQPSSRVPRRWASRDVILAEAIHRDDCLDREHAFVDAHFTLLLQGAFEETAGSWTRTMHPLSAAFSPPSFGHRDHTGRGGAQLFTVWLRRSMAEEFLNHAGFWRLPHLWESALIGLPLLRLYTDLANTPESLDEFEVEDRLAQLIGTAHSQQRTREARRPRWVDGARDRITDCPHAPLRVTDLAREAGVHPVHFSRTFRQFVGVRPAEYRARTRVVAGCRLAASTSLPLAQVALAAGFADQSHMTRAFGRVLGIAPAAYRALVNHDAHRLDVKR